MSKKVIIRKYVVLAIIGVCLAGSALFIVNAKKNDGNTVFQGNNNGFEEGFPDSPEVMKNENIEEVETNSVEETDTYVRIWTDEELIDMERSNILYRLAQKYEILQYEYRGEIPQDVKAIPELDKPEAYGSLCAMEEFCGGTNFTVLAAEHVSIFGGWIVLFENDDKQYACAICNMYIYICDVAVWEELVGNIEKSNALSQLAEQYAILRYIYSGETPQDIKVMHGLEELDAYGSLCAMEEFCGGIDFTVLAVEQIGYSWIVLFEKANKQYVCAIGEVSTFFTICDVAVWEELVGKESVSG